MQILEKDIENKVVRYAKQRGCLVRKINGRGFRGWPDRLFITANGVFWIEFKRPGKTLDPAQEVVVAELTERGQRVYLVDDVEKGCLIVDAECDE